MKAALAKLKAWFVGTKLARSYINVFRIVARYWRAYGGWGDLFASVYFHVALAITALAYGYWTVVSSSSAWWDMVISIVPNLLGFTLGGYALLVAFLGEKFRKGISGNKVLPDGKKAESPFVVMNASFAHYIVVQVLALVSAAVCKACHDTSLLGNASALLHISRESLGDVVRGLWGVSFLFFAYAMTLGAAAAFSVFRVGTWLDKHDNDAKDEEEKQVAEAVATVIATPPPPTALPMPPVMHYTTATAPAPAAVAPKTQAELEAEREAEAELEATEALVHQALDEQKH